MELCKMSTWSPFLNINLIDWLHRIIYSARGMTPWETTINAIHLDPLQVYYLQAWAARSKLILFVPDLSDAGRPPRIFGVEIHAATHWPCSVCGADGLPWLT